MHTSPEDKVYDMEHVTRPQVSGRSWDLVRCSVIPNFLESGLWKVSMNGPDIDHSRDMGGLTEQICYNEWEPFQVNKKEEPSLLLAAR
jgi:hypothetical protein